MSEKRLSVDVTVGTGGGSRKHLAPPAGAHHRASEEELRRMIRDATF